jgi:hypothetical protein
MEPIRVSPVVIPYTIRKSMRVSLVNQTNTQQNRQAGPLNIRSCEHYLRVPVD